MRARLIKGRKAPNKPKQPTCEQYLSAELPKVLRKFQGKRYTLATASKIVNELQQVRPGKAGSVNCVSSFARRHSTLTTAYRTALFLWKP